MSCDNNILSFGGQAFVDQNTAHAAIGPRILQDFVTCYETAWENYKQVVRPLAPAALPKSIANIYREMVIEEVRNRIVNQPGVVVSEPFDRFLLEIRETILVQFRKLGPDFITSNNPTRTSIDFDCQLELPGITLPRVIAGYQPNPFWTEITGLFLVFNVGTGRGSNVWWHNLVTGEHSLPFPMPTEGAAEREAREELRRRQTARRQADPGAS